MSLLPSPPDYGPQYAEDDGFKAAARLHQSRCRVDQLGVPDYREYGNRLPTSAALAGLNFYPWPGLLNAVAKRFKRGDKKLYWDMLGSDHIPFNFFIPLRELAFTPSLIAAWTNDELVRSISKIDVEWAPPRDEHLGDNTSFDAYVEYVRSDDTRGGVGIEVKYTEQEYSWGKREKAQMLDLESAYHRVHGAAGLYGEGAVTELATKRLKQFWRNQLLGEAMLQRRSISRFTSVLLYPSANEHFGRAAGRYAGLLKVASRHRFAAVTYEEFISAARRLGGGADALAWLDYLEKRYIVAPKVDR